MSGLVGGPEYGLTYGLAFALVLALVGGLAFGLSAPATLSEAVTPTSTLANDRRAGRLTGSAAGLVGWLSGGLLGGIATGVVLTTATGSWLAFVKARVWLAMRRRLPQDLMLFLQDAHRRGVLRQTGAVYQFRHARVQQHLAALYRSARPPVARR